MTLRLNPNAQARVAQKLSQPDSHFKPLVGEAEVLPMDAAVISQKFQDGQALRARVPMGWGATVGAAAAGGFLGGAAGVLLTTALTGFSVNSWTVAGATLGAGLGGWLFSRPGGEELVEVEAPRSLGHLAAVMKDMPGVNYREFGLAAFIDEQGKDRYFLSRGGMMAVATPGTLMDQSGLKLVNVGQVAHSHPKFTLPGVSTGDLYELQNSGWSGQHEAILVQANGDWSVYDEKGARAPSEALAASTVQALFS